VLNYNLQIKQSSGGNIQSSQPSKNKKQTGIPSLSDTKNNVKTTIHPQNKKNKDLDKYDTMNNIVEYSDSFSMSNSIEHNKKLKSDSMKKSVVSNKQSLDIIDENMTFNNVKNDIEID